MLKLCSPPLLPYDICFITFKGGRIDSAVLQLDLVEGKMKVSKTEGAKDEDIIFKAIDILQLLSRRNQHVGQYERQITIANMRSSRLGIKKGGFATYLGSVRNNFLHGGIFWLVS